MRNDRMSLARGMTAAAALTLGAMACVNGDTVGTTEDTSGNRDVQLSQEFTMRPGDTVRVEGTHVLVHFDGVSEDSRCPIDVQCPWAGNAAVRLELSSDNAEFAPQMVVLNIPQAPGSIEFMGVTLQIVDLTPYPRTDTPPIDPSSYVVTLVATRT